MKRSIIYILIVIAGYVILLFTAFLLWHQRLNSIQFPHGFCNEWDIVHDYRCGGITLDSASTNLNMIWKEENVEYGEGV